MVLNLLLQNAKSQDCSYHSYPSNCNSEMIMNEGNNWVFGKNCYLDFNFNPPHASYVAGIDHLEGCASISDASGNLVLSTNFTVNSNGLYMNLIDANMNPIINSTNLEGSYSATQNSLIVRQPGRESIYYVFTIDLPASSGNGGGFTYSIIDLSKSDKVISKNAQLLPNVSEKITAINHANQHDIWIIVHEWNNSIFKAYLLTEKGLQQPIVSNIGSEHSEDKYLINAIGQLKISPTGCRIASAIYGKGLIELFDFNTSSGHLSNCRTSPPNFKGAYGVEFSPDGKYLFVSISDFSLDTNFSSKLYCFDLGNGNTVFTNPYLIESSDTIDFLGLQVAVDGKIYVASAKREQLPNQGNNSICVLNNPNRGIYCNLNTLNHQSGKILNLNGGKCRIGLPNFNQSYFLTPKITYEYNCSEELTYFNLLNSSNIDSVNWDFGDGSFSSSTSPAHKYDQNGYYTVKHTEYFDDIGFTDSMTIVINPKPVALINNGIDTAILVPGSRLELNAGSGYKYYNWSNGSQSQIIHVNEDGYYWVEVQNNYCCGDIDSIYVQKLKIAIPNAFCPNSAGLDSKFQMLDPDNEVISFSIKIYNKLGQLVFESNSKDFSWDGSGYPTDVFYYSFLADLKYGFKYQKNGNVTLVR